MCRHCKVEALDEDQPETNLCAQCLDYAVWGTECDLCGEVPTGKRGDHCDE